MKVIRILLIVCTVALMLAVAFLWFDRTYAVLTCIGLVLVLFCVLWTQLKNVATTIRFLTKETRPQFVSETPNRPTAELKGRDMLLFINQINPHFLYNTLDGIRGQALANDQWEIAQMTEKLSRFFRYCISSRGDIVRLAEEVRNVQDYFGIQKFRFGDRIQLHMQIEDQDVLQYYVPKLTIQPIVENAIVHGIEGFNGKGEIWLKIKATENTLYINVVDNGGGMSMEQLIRLREKLDSSAGDVAAGDGKHTGIAIHNVHSRIRLCFGTGYGLNYRSMPGAGTNVEISMPLVDDFSRASLESKLRDVW